MAPRFILKRVKNGSVKVFYCWQSLLGDCQTDKDNADKIIVQ